MRSFIKKSKPVIKNYFYFTALQVQSIVYFFLIYPILIKRLGTADFGFIVFSHTLIGFILIVVNFGFNYTGLNETSKNKFNYSIISTIFSKIICSQILIFIIISVFFMSTLFFYKTILINKLFLGIIYFSILGNLLSPQWLFHGVEKIGFYSILQIIGKILNIIFIYYFVKSTKDILIYSVIFTLNSIIIGLITWFFITRVMRISFVWMTPKFLKESFKEALPFFWGNSLSNLKTSGTTFLISIYLSFTDITIYDFSNKMNLVPTILLANINNSLFNKFLDVDEKMKKLKIIIIFQLLLGILPTLFFLFFGEYIIKFFVGSALLNSYKYVVLMSLSTPLLLVVGAIQLLIFIPEKKYLYVRNSQVYAFFIYFTLMAISLILFKSLTLALLSILISLLFEVIYSLNKVNKWKR